MIHTRSKKKIRKEEDSLQQKASLTVECAFVLPLFFFLIVVIISMMDLYRITALMQTALSEGAKELGMYAYCDAGNSLSPVGIVEDGICMAYGRKKINEAMKSEPLFGVKGGIHGILLAGSAYQEDLVKMKATFFYQAPLGIFRLFPAKITVKSQARAWTGFHGTLYGTAGEEEEMVYITDWESVYHTTDSCTHLKLSVEKVGLEQAKNGYRPCESCIGHGKANSMVYITQTGEAYHNRADCGGISRNVRLVKKSETAAFRPCERCGGGK